MQSQTCVNIVVQGAPVLSAYIYSTIGHQNQSAVYLQLLFKDLMSQIMQKQEKEASRSIYPICEKHNQPCHLICPDKSCKEKFICYHQDCGKQHKLFINVYAFHESLMKYKNIQQTFTQQTEEMIEGYFDRTTQAILQKINKYKKMAITKLHQLKVTITDDVYQQDAKVLQCLINDWDACPKQQFLLGWDLLKNGQKALIQDTNIVHFSQLFQLKIKNQKSLLQNLNLVAFQQLYTFAPMGFESLYITYRQLRQFIQMMTTKQISIFKLQQLFDASNVCFSPQEFHRTCDNKGATLTVVRSQNNCLFGGFCPESFTSKEGYIDSDNSFLFSVDHKDIWETSLIQKKYALLNHPSKGPTWGRGPDLQIIGIDGKSYFKSYYCDKNKQIRTINGQINFDIKNYVVFKVNK